jgi:hypothetical protein
MKHEATTPQPAAIRSERCGPHWSAWLADGDGNPEQSVVFVGLTREEAEERVRRWRDEELSST